MKKVYFFIITYFSLLIGFAQEQNPFYVGHSLVNFDMPLMVQALANDAGKTSFFDQQITNGATLQANYNNAASAQGTPYTTAFPSGNFNTLVITEAIPLQNHLTWSDTYTYANNFYNYAKNNNNGTPLRFYIYETWHCINSGLPAGCDYDNSANSNTLWQPRLQADFSLWSGIVTDVRNQNPNNDEIWMIPAGQAFYNLAAEIDAGNLPGITSFTDLFTDDIHLTNAGNYFIACVMYASIYRESPVGLTTSINNQWNTPYANMPTSNQATIMQQVAWNTVSNLSSWTGVSGSTLSNLDVAEEKSNFSIYPNPTTNFITIKSNSLKHLDDIKIYNSIGLFVGSYKIENMTIDISNLSSGVYFIKLKNHASSVQKFIKQ
ncbi:T9SS type A sorting domain-containing protein [Lacinutrix salivirga]